MRHEPRRFDKFCDAMMHCIVGISNLAMNSHDAKLDTTTAYNFGLLKFSQRYLETISGFGIYV